MRFLAHLDSHGSQIERRAAGEQRLPVFFGVANRVAGNIRPAKQQRTK
jgi:hypothetical protein